MKININWFNEIDECSISEAISKLEKLKEEQGDLILSCVVGYEGIESFYLESESDS